MLSILALLCLPAAIGVLVVLSVIDLKIGLLPNVYNGLLAVIGVAFHALAQFSILSPFDMLIGAAMGAGFLYAVRLVANKCYDDDALGLGDVKLLGAAGLWLGPDGVLIALITGALAGLAHGLIVILYDRVKTGQFHSLARFSIPAGPGFAVGIFIAGAMVFTPFVLEVFS